MSTTDTTVIIIGAGLTGIASSYYLGRADIPHLILEKKEEVGGIWSSQSWPGMRCDTDIIKYSYSFKPFLSKKCLVPGEAIANYLRAVCQEFEIQGKILFGTKVEKAVFRTDENRWFVHTYRGVFRAKFLLNANGYFWDAPHIPEFPGSRKFKGEIVHLFHLDKKIDLTQKQVVLVGSGASAITAAPSLCDKSLSMTLLQRSPSYIYEGSERVGVFVDCAQRLYRFGFKYPVRVVNFLIQLKDDLVFILCRTFPRLAKLMFKRHWKDTVDEEKFRDHFQPRYNPWEQRICLSIGLKKAIIEKKLKIVTGQIKKIAESGIILNDDRLLETNYIILATGFNLAFFKFDVFIDAHRVQTEGINFYKGMMMGGIPNYFQPFGPPHSSFTGRVETISKLIVKIILHMKKHRIDTVTIDRRKVSPKPRITPGYVMRSLPNLPCIYGTTQLPSIDNLVFSRFKESNFHFTRHSRSEKIAVKRIQPLQLDHGTLDSIVE